MTVKVFLCHAIEDKPQVQDLYRQLKDHGFRPWLDSENLIAGQDWDMEIQQAVRSSDVVVVCLSTSSVTKTGYVQKEIRIALDTAEHHPEGQIYIVPVRLCPCDIPVRLKKWHALDLYEEGGLEKLERSLLTRTLIGAIWRSSDDDPTGIERDAVFLKQQRELMAALSPPTTDEVLDELRHSVEAIKADARIHTARIFCMTSRTVILHIHEVAQQPNAAVRRLVPLPELNRNPLENWYR